MKHASFKQVMVIFTAVFAWTVAAQAADSPAVLGWAEKVAIQDSDLVMHAKIDTGADNTSINATDIDYIDRDGETWVRFNIITRNGTRLAMERPLLRITRIKRKEGGSLERPVVNMGFCVAGHLVDAEVNLADRGHFEYPLLVGRSMMASRFVVDPQRTYITQPACASI